MHDIRISNVENTIYISPKFNRASSDPYSVQYAKLQEVRNDYPNYKLVIKGAKRNENKECYKGLTYDYMRGYIKNHVDGEEQVKAATEELDYMIDISKCHSIRYAAIKSWFLEKYPEVKLYGTKEVDTNGDCA